MKKILAFALAACLVLGLAACGSGAPASSAPATGSVEPGENTAPPTEPAATTQPVSTPEPTQPAETPEIPVETEQPEDSPEPVTTEKSPVQTTQPTQPPAPQDLKSVAEGYIGKDISGLYAAIGYPLSSDYAPSCLGEGGEDGNLYYDGFIVYTYRENGVETVNYVE